MYVCELMLNISADTSHLYNLLKAYQVSGPGEQETLVRDNIDLLIGRFFHCIILCNRVLILHPTNGWRECMT